MVLDLVKPFVNATMSVLQTMASTTPVPGDPVVKTGEATFGAITGVIGMAGPQTTGNLLISFDEKSILGIVSRMLRDEFTTLDADVVDAVGEITNMICGGAKKELAELGLVVDLATPIVITGHELKLQQMGHTPMLTIPFSTQDGFFMVETNIERKQ